MPRKFLDLAHAGKNQWWRYLLSIVFVLFSGLIIGSIPSIILAVFVESDTNPITQLNRATGQIEGVDSITEFLLLNFTFICFLISLYLAIRFIHQRRFITLITPHKKVNWKRIFQGFSVYFILLIFVSLIEFILTPNNHKLTFEPSSFLIFLPIALILTPIQTSVEELFFRGYLMQGIGLLTKKPMIPVFLISFLFMLLHLGNPEVAAGFFQLATYYFVMALFLGFITIKDNSLELALGVHAANNLFTVLFVNSLDSALPSPSIFTSLKINPELAVISLSVNVGLFYLLFFRKPITQ